MTVFLRAIVLLALIWLIGSAMPSAAQDSAALIAQTVRIDGESRLIAEGDVEVLYKGRRLRASRIVFDRAADRLTIDGPIVLTDDQGTLILASQADLGADLTEGILTSARLVLDQQLQLAAARMMRVGGRYTQLDKAVASSCQVCAANPVPLWEIRARRIVHDQVERQIYFDHAQLRMAGVPVLYLPRLRMPDPSLTRATGLLMPSIRTTSGLGTGIKLPYFLRIGDQADLTLTPYLSTKNAKALEFRYRQAFATGDIILTGSLARDDLVAGRRGFAKAQGSFTLPQGFVLDVQLEEISDNAFYLDYGLGDIDRLENRVEVSRTRRNEHISARVLRFDTLRDDEDSDTIPSRLADFTFHRRFSLGPLGGEGGLRFQTHSHYRNSTDPLDGPDPDVTADGRDMSRVSLRVDWRRSFYLPMGIEGTLLGEAGADVYDVRQDAVFSGRSRRSGATLGAELRWPWTKVGRGGAVHVIEPVAQLVWAADEDDASLPNEDSTLVSFDEGNLFAMDRFPGSDATEGGLRLNAGLTWTRHDPQGWSSAVTLGRVWREADLGQFSAGSGLDGKRSDWLAAAQVMAADGYGVTGRVAFDDEFSPSKAELQLRLVGERYSADGGYLWTEADPTENRPDPTSEMTFDGQYALTPNWTGKLSGRYDFEASRGTVAGLGLVFRNECLLVDLSLSRRFTSSTSVRPTTSFGLSVDLLGFGGRGQAGPARRCLR